MKKKSFRLLALLALSLSLAACSKGGSALGYDSQVPLRASCGRGRPWARRRS